MRSTSPRTRGEVKQRSTVRFEKVIALYRGFGMRLNLTLLPSVWRVAM